MVWMVHCALGRTGPLVGRSTCVGPSGSESRLLSWLVMTMGNRIHHGVTSVKYTVPVQFDVSNAVLWALWILRGRDIHIRLQSCRKPWALLLRDAQASVHMPDPIADRPACAAGRWLLMRRLLASTLQKGPCLCDGGNSKMDLLCKTSDAARAGSQVGGQARPDRTRRDAMGEQPPIGQKSCHTVRYSVPYSPVQFWQPQDLAGERVRDEGPGVMDVKALRWRMQDPRMRDDALCCWAGRLLTWCCSAPHCRCCRLAALR